MTHHGQPEPYGPPQLPSQPYGERYAPQQPPYMPPPTPSQPRSQALAVTALVAGVIAVVAALWVVSRGVAPFIGLVALVLAIVALVAKKQGGTTLAAAGLALGMLSIPLAVILWTVATNQQTSSEQQVQQMTDCINKKADDILACAGH
jgi:ABC-type sugar transport system substrate-binding protein